MSTLDDIGDPDRSPRAGAFARLAHLLGPIAAITLAESVARWFGTVPWWIDAAWFGVVLAVYVVALVHQELARICLRCMEEVPADAPVRAQHRRWLFRYQHFVVTWKFTVAYLAAGLAIALLRSWVYPDHVAGDNVGAWMAAPLDIVFVLMLASMIVHHRLSPWCPFCKRWDEGGEHEESPIPSPDPSGAKSA